MRLRKRIWAAALGLGFIVACNTPSVPLPPPDVPALSFEVPAGTPAGMIALKGKPSQRHVDVRFYVIDQSSGDGVITTTAHDGSFETAPFAAKEMDSVQMYYDSAEGERSEELCVTLVLNTMLISTRCQ
jgi:hypothetical protein